MSTPENTIDLTCEETATQRMAHGLSLIDKKKLREVIGNRCILCRGGHKFQNCDAETTKQLKTTILNCNVEQLEEVLQTPPALCKVQLRYAHFITGNLPYPSHGCQLKSSQMNNRELRNRIRMCIRAKYVLNIVIALVSSVRQGKMTHAVCCFTIQCFLEESQTRGIKIASLLEIANRWIFRGQRQGAGALKL